MQLPSGQFGTILCDPPFSEVAGYKRSPRDAYISRLAARELVQADDPGWVKAADRLFE